MSDNHFSYFRVKNFKRFKDLEVKDIGQFNLVLGDNNVGKTSLLEAMLFEPNFTQFEAALYKVFKFRNIGNIETCDTFKFFINNDVLVSKDHNFLEVSFSFSGETRTCGYYFVFDHFDGHSFVDLDFSFQIDQKRITLGEFSDREIPFIPFAYGYKNDLAQVYSEYIQTNRHLKRQLIHELKQVDSSIEDIEISLVNGNPTLTCYTSDSISTVLLAMMGDGLVRFFRIMMHIISNGGQHLLIDEIDTGIHYSRMKDYWKVILQSANENNVQIFATTHNKECMESFSEALKELGNDYTQKARSITLKESPKTGDIKAFTNSYEVLEDALEIGNDLR